MYLTEQHTIKQSNPMYKALDKVSFNAKNLYNAGLYAVRQHYFENNTFLNYINLNNNFVVNHNADYYNLPAKVSQQVLKTVEQGFKSFFALCKLKAKGGYEKKVRIPKYLDKVKGRAVVTYTNQAISKKSLREGVIKLSGLDIEIHTNHREIQQVRIVPKNGFYVIEVIYKVEEDDLIEDNGLYASIDLGVNNLATIGFNQDKPIILNGRPVKSINQYYNKQLAHYKSKLDKGQKTSKRIQKLTQKRNNKIKDYIHKGTRYITNQLATNGVCKLIIGLNKEWKQEVSIGSRNNQNFVQIPHSNFVSTLEYKCRLKGITVVTTEESYTSKCSFLDNEKLCKHDKYAGKRVKRGLFRCANGKLWNADQNGALNIMRKVVGEFQYSIEACSTPLKVSLKQS